MRQPLLASTLVSVLIAALAPPARCAPLVRLSAGSPGPAPVLVPVIVQSRLGGQIFGFDIDPDGTEGILSEAQVAGDGTVLAAVETFDQRTGAILGIVTQRRTEDDFVTLGVVGHHVGLVEYEHQIAFLDVERTFPTIEPLASSHFNGRWRPPIDEHHLIETVSRNHATDTFVAYAYDNSQSFEPQVFSSNLTDGTFGPLIVMTDPSFQTGLVPKLAYDEATKKAGVKRCSSIGICDFRFAIEEPAFQSQIANQKSKITQSVLFPDTVNGTTASVGARWIASRSQANIL